MRRWTTFLATAALSAALASQAQAFGLGETMAATGTQAALAAHSAPAAGRTVGHVRQRMAESVRTRENGMRTGLDGRAAQRATTGAGATKWMTAATAVAVGPSDAWATLSSGPGGGGGWYQAGAYAGAGEDAWATATDAWARGGILPD